MQYLLELCYQDDDLRIGTGDFTAEGWFWISADTIATGTYHALFDTSKSTTYGYENTTHTTHIGFWLRNDYALRIYSGGSAALGTTSNTLNVNEWNHCALVRSGTTVTMYINGVSGGTFSSSANYNLNSVAFGVAPRWTTSYTAGPMYVGNFRLEVGNARYTANFTPPTTAFESTADTVFLKNYNNHQALIGGVKTNSVHSTDVEVSAFNPFGQGSEYTAGENKGSVYFDGLSYLTNNTAALSLSSGVAWSISFWYYSSDTSGTQVVIAGDQSGGAFESYFSNGTLKIGGALVAVYVTIPAADLPLNAWTHVAIVKNAGDVATAYVNGISKASGAWSVENPSTGFKIGSYPSQYGFTGYLSDIRWSIGQTDYTTNFTPPTAPVGNTNASLYLPMDNAGIFDKTGNSTINPNSVVTQTSDTVYASSTMSFNGSTFIRLESPLHQILDNEEFTLEFHVKITENETRNCIFGIGDHSTNDLSFFCQDNGQYKLNPYGSYSTAYNALWDNNWHHFAISRSSGTLRAFIDGTVVASHVSTNDYGTTAQVLNIGYLQSFNGYQFQGYIENFQFIRGVSKYAANFTPPTQEQGRGYQAES